jgi:23S rRNA (cytidine2498-2'-O)-methyltransferase
VIPASFHSIAADRIAAVANRIIFSAAEDSFHIASRELEDCFGRQISIERLGPDVGVFAAPEIDLADVARACDEHRIVLIKHLSAEAAVLPDPAGLAERALEIVTERESPPDLSVQVWVSGRNRFGQGPAEIARLVVDRLRDDGYRPGRAGHKHVLSVCLTPGEVLVGFNEARLALSDWPGGRVRLFRGDDQVSRSEFKLEELFQTFPVELPAHGLAVDFGAAPGGWTRIIRQRGLEVLAVDPGDLDPRVAGDPGVRHLRTTAGEFLRADRRRLDLALNDMRMEPVLSAELMVTAARHLKRGATAVVTLKVGLSRVLATVDRCLELLAGEFEVVAARQLHHNRKEVTVLLQRR